MTAVSDMNHAPRIGSLFSGYGGLEMGVQEVLGGSVAWHCEFDAAPSRVLAHHHPDVPNLGDITGVDWDAVPPIDILVGGVPCQDVSHAGKRLGLRPDTRTGLWAHMAHAIDRLRPQLVVFENVGGILSARTFQSADVRRVGPRGGRRVEVTNRALGRVVADLAALGYVCRWGSVEAARAGAPHRRLRVFLVAHPADADISRLEGWIQRGRERAGERPAGAGGVAAGVSLLPTPKASDGPNGGPGMRNGRGEADALPGVVALLPTPVVTDSFGARNETSGRSNPESRHHAGTTLGDVAWKGSWGAYAPAIQRWERVTGRRAPSPTEPGRDGRPRLSPLFTEWMMGLPAGHVTDPAIGLTRAQQLKMCGNGVVPQQAATALRLIFGLPWEGVGQGGALLPTPAVNDMGEGKSIADWDAWTERMKALHANGNGHGRSLAIEAARLAPAEIEGQLALF